MQRVGNYIINIFTSEDIENISLYNNEVLLRVTNHTGQAEKNLLGPAGIRTRNLRFTSSMLYQDFSLLVRYGSSLGVTPHYSPPEFTVP